MVAKERKSLYAGLGDRLEVKPRDPNTAPQTSPAKLMEFNDAALEWKARVDDLTQKLEEAGKGATRMFPLDRLHKKEGRQKTLSPEDADKLRENLRFNKLDSPITVVRREDGDWRIVSGNNRVDMYRELGRTEIEGVEKDYDEIEEDKQAFFSNLLHDSLTAFGKYQGFKTLIDNHGYTQDEIAKFSGYVASEISRIMSFAKLPDEAIEIIKQNPSSVGANTVAEIASIINGGKKERALDALRDIVSGKSEQGAAVEKAKKPESITAAKSSVDVNEYKIKKGKASYADIRAVDKTIRISLKDSANRSILAEKIYALIKEYSENN